MAESSQDTPARLLALEPIVSPDELVLQAERYTVGRSSTCDVVVSARIVSRVHAQIVRDGPRYLLLDAGSANGTFVNGTRLAQPHTLKHNDTIGLGIVQGSLRFLDPDPTFVPVSPVPVSTLHYDEQALQFLLNRRPLELSQSQFRLLLHLYRHAGALCTRGSCAEAIWGRTYEPGMDAAALDRMVANLRAALRAAEPDAELIQTRRGVGYVLNLA